MIFPKRSSFPCPAIRSSGMRSIQSMADGRTYDDRNDYDRSLRESGHRILEAGEKPTAPEPRGAREIIEREMAKHV